MGGDDVETIDMAEPGTTPEASTPPPAKPPKKRRFGRFKDWWHGLSKRKKTLLVVLVLVLLAGGGVGAYMLLAKDEAPQKAAVKKQEPKKAPPKPTSVPSALTGLPVSPSFNDRPVTGIMIENSLDARPQAGLYHAGVVFEAIAEGGITRFLTLFQDTEPDPIGPVRSVRPYYVQWAMGFNAAIAHVGGSAEALQNMRDWGARDLDQFAGGAYFWRTSDRFAPHNVYTSIAKLREYSAKKGYGKSNFTPLPRKAKETKLATPTARVIDFDISGATFNAHYDYDAASNSYLRKVGGAPHMDEKENKQISPKVVVALIMPYGKNGIYSTYGTIGSGKVFVFQDGGVYEGSWHKESRDKNFTFTDAAGKPLMLNPGKTWFTALGAASEVSHAP